MDSLDDILTAGKNIASSLSSAAQAMLLVKGQQTISGIAANTVIYSGTGRLVSVEVTSAGSGSGMVYDSNSTSSTAYPLFSIPASVGIYRANLPVGYGISVAPGTGQVVNVVYSELKGILRTTPPSPPAPYTPDFYISNTGNDAGAGTQADPWAITTLLNPSSTHATANGPTNRGRLSGKTVGLLAGTYDLSGLVDTGHVNDENPILCIPSGSLGAPTQVVSCNNSGVYASSAVTLDAHNTAGGTGGSGAWHYAPAIGQTYNDTGYVTIDGLIVQNCNGANISFYGSFTGAGASITNIIVQNCTGQGTSTTVAGNNPGVIRLIGVKNSAFTNNKLYNYLTTNAGDGSDHLNAILAFGSNNCSYTYNTIYNSISSSGVHLKAASGTNSANDNKNCTIAYNFIEIPYAGSYGIFDFSSTDTSSVNVVHHNIVNADSVLLHGGYGCANEGLNSTPGPADSNVIYNNTFYSGLASTQTGRLTLGTSLTNGITFYNNAFYVPNSTAFGYLGLMDFGLLASTPPTISLSDYNCFVGYASANQVLMYGTTINSATNPGFWLLYPYTKTLAGWQAANSCDSHSVASSTVGITPVALTPSSYSPSSGAWYQTGKSNGTPGGVTCNMGAWDGVVAQIGSTL